MTKIQGHQATKQKVSDAFKVCHSICFVGLLLPAWFCCMVVHEKNLSVAHGRVTFHIATGAYFSAVCGPVMPVLEAIVVPVAIMFGVES